MKNRKAMISAFGKPEMIQILEEEIAMPKPGQVRVKIEASTVSATDIFIRKGIYPLLKEQPPMTMGYDFVGTIDLSAESSNSFKKGDRVCGIVMTGGNADYICLDPSELSRVPLDAELYAAACMVLSGISAYQMFVHYGKVKSGQRILVHGGSGAIGSTLLQLGRMYGCEMVSTASQAKHGLIKSYGATPVDYHAADYSKQLQGLSKDGFDAVFDFTNQKSFNLGMQLLKKGGTMVTYAVYSSSLTIEKRSFLNFLSFGADFGLMMIKLAFWNKFSGKNAVFYGSSDSRSLFPERHCDDMGKLFGLLNEGKISPLIHKVLTLEQVSYAHQLLQHGEVHGHLVISSVQ